MSEEYPDFITTIEDKQYTCHPVCRQEYKDCYFEAGFIDNHPKDPMYLVLKRNSEETFIYMRQDEVAAIAWVLNGLLWSNAINACEETVLMMLAKERKKLEKTNGLYIEAKQALEQIEGEYDTSGIAKAALETINNMEKQK